MSRLAIVVIGRNEGGRLARALDSVSGRGLAVAYVDSGSTDGSPALARARGALVTELDPGTPFTAARARNEGFAAIRAAHPEVDVVQFVDGDCEVVPGWLERAVKVLEERPDVAAVCGRVRERNRDLTIYNRLCDIEWDAPAGETRACGGNAAIRVGAFLEAGGFDGSLIAGEEPELCVRLRRGGWKILRVAEDMVLHDAAMTRFGQWWRRSTRAGWAYADGAALHGGSSERHWVRENRSIVLWGVILPLAAAAAAALTRGWGLALLAGYPVLAARIHVRMLRRGLTGADARLVAAFTVLGKFPQAIGLLQHAWHRARGRRRRLIDWRVAG